MAPSIRLAGLDPASLPRHAELDTKKEARAWKSIWSAGHGVGTIRGVPGAADLWGRLADEYAPAIARVISDPTPESKDGWLAALENRRTFRQHTIKRLAMVLRFMRDRLERGGHLEQRAQPHMLPLP